MKERILKKIGIEFLVPNNYRNVTGDFEDIQNSMLEKGQLEPLTVTPEIKDGKETDQFIIVNGERRFRAARNIIDSGIKTGFDFSKLDCIIDSSYNLDSKSEDFKFNQLILNEVHKATNFDTYLAVKSLVDTKKYTNVQISKALGKDDTWAGKVANMIIDSEEYRCYFSGKNIIYDKVSGKITGTVEEFEAAYKDIATKKDIERLIVFLRSDLEQSEWEKENGRIFETESLNSILVFRGFGEKSAPSIWVAQSLVEFWNTYCIDHERKSEAHGFFSKMIKALMLKKVKSKPDIDKLVKSVKDKYFGDEEPVNQQAAKTFSPKDVAKRIFNVFKDIKFTDEEVKAVKKELRRLFKDEKLRDRIGVEISFALKQNDKESDND